MVDPFPRKGARSRTLWPGVLLARFPKDQAVPIGPLSLPGAACFSPPHPPTPRLPQAMPLQPGCPPGLEHSAPGPCNYVPQPGRPRASQHLAAVANFCFKMRDYL